MKQTIAIDIDDVISDTTEAMRIWGNKVTGVELTPEQYKVPGNDYWGYYERIWAQHGVDDRLKYDDFEAELIADQTQVPLVASASLVVEELQKRFHVILLTSRNPALEAGTREWLKDNLNGDIKLYFAKNGRINEGRSKGELCKELGAFLLIDDNVEHCQSAVDNGVKAILFGEYGWQNAAVEGAVSCRDWPAVLEYFDGRSFRDGLDA